jgi:type VI secretion system secreted protein VgrG
MVLPVASPLEIVSPLGPAALTAIALSGREELSGLFSFALDTLAPNDRPVAFEQLLGAPVLIRLDHPAGTRHFSGICSRIAQGERGQTTTAYRLNVVPQLWLTTHRVDVRAFELLSVPQIVERALAGAATFQLTRDYQPRDVSFQYNETDFAFISRLLEEEGIFYFFRHAADGHELVLGDTPAAHPDVAAPQALSFDPSAARKGQPAISEWTKAQEIRPGKVTLRDTNFELPGETFEVSADLPETVQAGTVVHRLRIDGNDKLELYDYPGGYAQRFDGIAPDGSEQPGELLRIAAEARRTVQTRIEAQAAGAVTVSGSSTCGNLVAGHRFTLERHVDANGGYVLTSVTHHARVTDTRKMLLEYRNEFTCIPDGVAARPARVAPRPVLSGVEPAVVVGPPGTEIHTDKYGRVKVQFAWDRSGAGGDSSVWIRVAQPYAGMQELQFLPAVGDEVLVAFEHGDPDRPYVLGSLWNPDRPPPRREE